MSEYSHWKAKDISSICWQSGDEVIVATVGRNGCVAIHEHAAAGEGDKWFYDVENESGEFLRVFNPLKVLFRFKVTDNSNK